MKRLAVTFFVILLAAWVPAVFAQDGVPVTNEVSGTEGTTNGVVRTAGETNREPFVNHLYGRAYLLGGTLIGFGVDYRYAPIGWVGINLGYTFFPYSQSISRMVNIFQPGIETGLYVLRNEARQMRAGLGLSLSYYTVADMTVWQSISTNQSSGVIVGAFLDGELRNFLLRVCFTYQPGAQEPFMIYPMIGIKY